MPREYTLPGGRKLRHGTPFEFRGYRFPANWLELAQPGDLAHWGIAVENVVDPIPPPPTVVEQARNKLASTVDRLLEFLEKDGSVPLAWREYRFELRRAARGARPDLPAEPEI